MMAMFWVSLVLLETLISTWMFSLCLGSQPINQNGDIPLVGRLYFNRYLPESELTRVYGRSFDQCRGECDARQSCKSVNYNRLVHSCVLNDADLDGSSPIAADQDIASGSGLWSRNFDRKRRDSPEDISLGLQEKANFIYSQKSHWQQDYHPPSGCPDDCDEAAKYTGSGNDATCTFAECATLAEDPENGFVLGNRNVEGSKLRLECDQGYTVTGHDVTQCQTGQWTPIGSCTRLCPNDWIHYERHCYRYRDEEINWYQAQHLCALVNSSLVIIEDEAENDFIERTIRAFVDPTAWFWLGGHRDASGGFVWHDGSDITFSDWSPFQPNDFQYNEDCIVAVPNTGDFDWHDVTCYDNFIFICESVVE